MFAVKRKKPGVELLESDTAAGAYTMLAENLLIVAAIYGNQAAVTLLQSCVHQRF